MAVVSGPAPEAGQCDVDELAALLVRMAGGDEAALRELYDAAVGPAWALAQRITGVSADAEEAVMDAFEQAWRMADRYDPARGSGMGWLMTICRARAIDLVRRRSVRSRAEADSAAQPPPPGPAEPPDILAIVQRDSAAHGLLGRLTPEQRQVLSLAYFRGMSHSEIAQAAGMPLGTVKSCIRRALLELRGAAEEMGL